MGLIAGFPASLGSRCEVRQWFLVVVCLVHALVTFVLRADRYSVLTALATINSLFTAAAFACHQLEVLNWAANAATAVMVLSGVGVIVAALIAAIRVRYGRPKRSGDSDGDSEWPLLDMPFTFIRADPSLGSAAVSSMEQVRNPLERPDTRRPSRVPFRRLDEADDEQL